MRLVLTAISRVFAMLGSGIGLAVAMMAVWSIVGRALVSKPILGDVELTQMGIAVCISLCLPWCQLQRGNIIVDFFTQNLRAAAQHRLDALGCVLMAAMYVLLAWRTMVGAVSVQEAFEQTMILGLPMWWAYASLAPGLALSAVVALWQSQRLWRQLPLDDHDANVAAGGSDAQAKANGVTA